ncbi:hypothetical protein Vretifemale_18695 [Volvox reticuliferus]|uniref:Uncharacterized protein n=1 Tax=Volvox reticuliferus TaxID=1737510 RepID=A0A8J4CWB0_9CHLO|nr:hypothetical protein Vretifemale_18695 [Volvox reticuliferus]
MTMWAASSAPSLPPCRPPAVPLPSRRIVSCHHVLDIPATPGYVSGMQCDVWLNRPDFNARSSAPLIKFRLPTALAHTARGISGSLPGALLMGIDTDVYSIFNSSGCSAIETAVSGNCSAAAGFVLTDVVNKGNVLTDAAPSYMRCWTYVNNGFTNGTVQTLKPIEASIYLGSQRVLASPDTISIFSPSFAPNTTTLSGYYQLLVMEFPGLRPSSLAGIRNGSGKGFMVINTVNTLLPIPLIGGGNAAATTNTNTASRGLRRRHLSGSADHSFNRDLDYNLKHFDRNMPYRQYEQQIHAGGQVMSTGNINQHDDINDLNQRQLDRRQLQLDLPANSVYDPKALGANSYTGAVTQRARGLCGFFSAMDASITDQTLKMPTVFYNFTFNTSPGIPCNNASAGLSDAVCPFGTTNNNGPHRMAQFEGFLRLPSSAGSGTTMRPWVLRMTDDASPLQTTSITMGDVTVRNGVESPNPVRVGETVIWLPSNSNADLFLPAVVTARIRPAGTQIVFNVSVITPELLTQRVDNNYWYCNNG